MVPLIELAQGLPWLYLSLIFLFSLMVGSFLNVVIHRLPLMMERQWMSDAAVQLSDTADLQRAAGLPKGEADKLVGAVESLHAKLAALPHLGIAMPRSRCNCASRRACSSSASAKSGWSLISVSSVARLSAKSPDCRRALARLSRASR